MKITQAENSHGAKFSKSGVSITFRTRTFLPVESYVKIVHDGKTNHFSVARSITEPFEDIPGASKNAGLLVTATETGYHGSKFSNFFDPRLLLEAEVVPVTEKDEIAEIRKVSNYC